MTPLTRLPDGTVKQVNPLTGTQVWTVPGRANRPLSAPAAHATPIATAGADMLCAFCPGRLLDTPPEKARRTVSGDGWEDTRGIPAEDLNAPRADFRVIPNLFEIMSLSYWRVNHDVTLSPAELARREAYLATPGGEAHVRALATAHRPGLGPDPSLEQLAQDSIMGGFHDVIVGRRHVVDGATHDDDLASASTLSHAEHRAYVDLTLQTMRELYAVNPHVRNVIAFQNWLRPAGASFDHLHKQVVAIDELGRWRETEVLRLRRDPDLFERYAVGLVREHDLLIASTEHAILFAGVGHRYPSLEVWARRPGTDLWDVTPAEVRDIADLVHAAHTVTGPGVPVNEEWHHRPPAIDLPMPLRAILKWRISTPAGFEGGSRIYINTIDPWGVRDRARTALRQAQEQGQVLESVTVAG